MADIIAKIDELIEKPCYLVDVFPYIVPETADRRYFAIEEYFQANRREWDEKFRRLLLKLYCYHDFWVSFGKESAENPEPRLLAKWIQDCFAGNWRERDYMNIILPDCSAMVILNGDDLYMSVYNPDEQLRALISQLAGAEGFFFYKAPGAQA